MRAHQYWVLDGGLEGTAYRVSGGGDLDLAARPSLAEALERAVASGAHTLELDFTDVAFIDSTAIKVLVRAAVAVKERGGKLEVSVSSPNVLRIFAIAGVDRLFEVTLTLPTVPDEVEPV
ncbi:MAG TPA: STAS domain-containing protein [Thermoleophilaceae bacterium]